MSAFPARGPVSDAADFGNWLSGGDQPAKKGRVRPFCRRRSCRCRSGAHERSVRNPPKQSTLYVLRLDTTDRMEAAPEIQPIHLLPKDAGPRRNARTVLGYAAALGAGLLLLRLAMLHEFFQVAGDSLVY